MSVNDGHGDLIFNDAHRNIVVYIGNGIGKLYKSTRGLAFSNLNEGSLSDLIIADGNGDNTLIYMSKISNETKSIN